MRTIPAESRGVVRELACVPPSAGICYLCTFHGIFLLASATVGRICYLGTLNSICLFSCHSTSATVGRICYLGTLNSICLFSFHSASATIGGICYLGTPSGIFLFSFHFALATIDRITVSRHVRQQLPLWQLESLVHELACAPPSAGMLSSHTQRSLPRMLPLRIGHRRPDMLSRHAQRHLPL